MIPVVGMFRGLFLGSVLVWYSSSVWKTMDNYYNQEFKKYMQKEKQARRFPAENEVCSALPDAPCAAAAARDEAVGAAGGGGGNEDVGEGGGEDGSVEALGANAAADVGASSEDEGGGGGGDGSAEALGANAAPEGSEGGGGGVGGCTVNRDVTHTGAWRRRAGTAASDSEDDGDTCPALF
ncbi:hypothetical protein R5R35_010105 [Gryllus longicercus]|uniref:Accessory gland protein n=1 Tax=Gryllus longicercus TaxID=2509291 RepID=A0AAN9VMM9_9ORTH